MKENEYKRMKKKKGQERKKRKEKKRKEKKTIANKDPVSQNKQSLMPCLSFFF